uniref:uncharacterized protein LOC122601607 n=1 Tax=Erigeron canadensis TaxID=72917 RepID=UPI001CB92861|nr:uncharacterized protein LOC122601607 [Erigeron canadensis]
MSSSSSTESSIINDEELRYLYASNVNISNFVSVSLVDERNYDLWKDQMLCLLASQNMRGFVDTKYKLPQIKSSTIMEQYEGLVKGWIFRSLNESTHRSLDKYLQTENVWHDKEHKFIWERLESLYGSKQDPTDEDDDDLKKRMHDVLFPAEQVEVTTTTETKTPPDNSIHKKNFVKAIIDGRWLEAELILKKINNKDAATSTLTNLDTALHIAVKEGRNDFLERLLDFIDDENEIKVKDFSGNTALHEAAICNNKRAAEFLVKKCESLLFSVGSGNQTPLEKAYRLNKLDTFLYLWEAVNDGQQGKPETINRIEVEIQRNINFDILEDAISIKQYDIASRLVNAFPKVAIQDDRLLMAMATTFPSDLGFGEALICPSLNNFHQRIIKRSFSLYNAPRVLYTWADHVLWATRSLKEAMWLLQETVLILLVVPIAIVYPLYQLIRLLILVILYPFFMLYFLLWTVLAIAVTPIKCIEKKRKKYQEAKKFLSIICNHIDKLGTFDMGHPRYSKPFLEAVRQGAYEVADEILYRSPKLILECDWSEKGHAFIELAIINRSEKNIQHYLSLECWNR